MIRHLLSVLALAGLFLLPSVAAAKSEPLSPEQEQWLEDVSWIISKEEKKAFKALDKAYQRDAFIRRFWDSRDLDPETPRNEFKQRFYSRLADARREYDHPRDERQKVYLFHGEPGRILETDCGLLLWPLQIWTYGYSEVVGGSLTVIFYQRSGGGPFLIWRPTEGYQVLFGLGGSNRSDNFEVILRNHCTESIDFVDDMIQTFRIYEQDNPFGPLHALNPPPPGDPEWLRTFQAFSTDASPEAVALAGELDWEFLGRHGLRTVVEGRVRLDTEGVASVRLGESETYNFLLTGEVLREGELFDSFRYRFAIPVRAAGTPSAELVFERYLRSGSYDLVLKIEDLNGAGELRKTVDLEVPTPAEAELVEESADGMDTPAPVEASSGPASIELVAHETELRSGLQRFVASVAGSEVAKVQFLLDDKVVLTKTRPPYSVELNLGDLPVTHRIRALALDRSGEALATDEVLMNAGEHTFIVRIVEPRAATRYDGQVRARIEVEAPAGRLVDRVELFLGETLVATLFQPPYIQTVSLADDALAFLRAVAFLDDGNSSEELVVFNTSQMFEDISVRVVELFATVVDGGGQTLDGLQQKDFSISDNGEPQTMLRFERLDDLPIYAGLLLDTSASMEESLKDVREVALGFLEDTIRPRDRACVITFSDTPRLAAEFTNDLTRLAGGLSGLTAERSTALYDSVMYGLYYFKGIKGQRALIVLSDGQDRRSEATFEEVLDFARSAGVTIYSIGFKLGKSGRVSRSRLTQMAVETGGRAFFVQSTSELAEIYSSIQRDLRSRYLLVYQPVIDGKGFRRVSVSVSVPDAEVRTMSGYIP